MCGIAGIVSEDSEAKNEIKKMIKVMRHRGPDGYGFFNFSNVHLGHTRLSIIDIEGGGQPMSDEKNELYIVFNGEIYNYLELRDILIVKGYKFRTKSDTEVLLSLYEEFGENMLQKLNGMFAFAIFNKKDNSVFIARDRMGIKPLYYYVDKDTFVFSSEINSIKNNKKITNKLSINTTAIWHYLSLLYIPQPLTIYNEIKVLPAGSYMIIKEGKYKIKRYWNLKIENNDTFNIEKEKKKLSSLFESSVAYRMQSDVPLGAYLSGGVDSSYMITKISEKAKERIKTFTAKIDNKSLDESRYAKEVSIKYETEHREFLVDKIDFELLDKLVSYFGQPFADSSIIPFYCVSKEIREYVTVALSGDGPDELFSGYDKYKNIDERSDDTEIESAFLNRVPPGLKEKIFSDNYLKNNKPEKTFDFLKKQLSDNYEGFDLLRMLDIEYFQKSDILTKVDVMSMASSLEVRVPYLDHRIVEFSMKIPKRYLFNNKKGKIILKDLVEDVFDKSFVNRQKIGLVLPINEWLKNTKIDFSKIIIPENIEHVFDKEKILQIHDKYKKGAYEYGNLLFAFYILYLWAKKNI